jgi:hypothetical protein
MNDKLAKMAFVRPNLRYPGTLIRWHSIASGTKACS